MTRTQGNRVCLRRFAACQGQSGRFVTHQSVLGVPALPEATSVQHVDAKALGVTHQSVWGVSEQPEATSVQHVDSKALGVIHHFLCGCWVAWRWADCSMLHPNQFWMTDGRRNGLDIRSCLALPGELAQARSKVASAHRLQSGAYADLLYWRRYPQFSNCLRTPPVQDGTACTRPYSTPLHTAKLPI